jgi:hypothetical protein
MRSSWALGLALVGFSGVAAAQSTPAALAAVATQQHPDAEPHPWRARPFALDAELGIATPFGLAGVSAEVAPIEYVSLGGGVGGNLLGVQYVGMARLRFTPERRASFYFGSGYTQGPHEQGQGTQDGVFGVFTGPLSSMGHSSPRGHTWKTARWINAELGVEQRGKQGIDMRGFLGSCFLLNPEDGVVGPDYGNQEPTLSVRTFMIYAGVGIGFSL